MNLPLLLSSIDDISVSCCSIMNAEEREQFFSYQEERDCNHLSAPRKSPRRNTYYKGKRKGEIKDVYNIDGFKFIKLWGLCKPYITKSVLKSCHNDYQKAEDIISEIKYEMFNVLRFFGPCPCDITFSSYLKLLVKNVLTNIANEKTYKKASVNLQAVSLFQNSPSFEEDQENLLDKIPNKNSQTVFLGILSSQMQKAVELLLGGERLTTVCKQVGMSKQEIQTKLMQCV